MASLHTRVDRKVPTWGGEIGITQHEGHQSHQEEDRRSRRSAEWLSAQDGRLAHVGLVQHSVLSDLAQS